MLLRSSHWKRGCALSRAVLVSQSGVAAVFHLMLAGHAAA